MLRTDTISRHCPSTLLLYSNETEKIWWLSRNGGHAPFLPQDCPLYLHVFRTHFASMACCKLCVCLGLAPVARRLLRHFMLHFCLSVSRRRLRQQLHRRMVRFHIFDTFRSLSQDVFGHKTKTTDTFLAVEDDCFGAKVKVITTFLSRWSSFIYGRLNTTVCSWPARYKVDRVRNSHTLKSYCSKK